MKEGDVRRIDQLIDNKDDIDGQNKIMKNDLERIQISNAQLGDKLKGEEIDTRNVGNKLQQATACKNNIAMESDSLNHNFASRIHKFEEISRDKTMV